MSLKPVDRALECLANNLAREELAALNRRIRIFRFCLIILFIGTAMACTSIFPRFSRFSTETIFVSASSWDSWHSFQVLYILTIFAPTLVIYYLASSLNQSPNSSSCKGSSWIIAFVVRSDHDFIDRFPHLCISRSNKIHRSIRLRRSTLC